jgi:23S rRNA (cytosine1962-C5)-methyltransferase
MSMPLFTQSLAFKTTAVATIKTGPRRNLGINLRICSLSTTSISQHQRAWSTVKNDAGRSRFHLQHGSRSARFATSSFTQQQQQQEEEEEKSTADPYSKDSANTCSSSSIPCVILRRSQQSKAFRNGNQLVFTRAIRNIIPSSTTSIKHKNKKKTRELSMGDLVQVKVEPDAQPKKKQSGSSNSTIAVDRDSYAYRQQQQALEQQQKPLTIGWGVYNPNSLYRIRILCHTFVQPLLHKALMLAVAAVTSEQEQVHVPDKDEDDPSTVALQKILQHHFARAIQMRRALNLPSSSSGSITTTIASTTTDTFRLVNGEGDQLSGLAVDVIGGKVAVVMSSAAWCQVHKDLILKCLRQAIATCTTSSGNHDAGEMETIWKTTPNRLQQDGYEEQEEEYKQENIDCDESDDHTSVNDNTEIETDDNRMVIGTENGIQYATFPFRKSGQKTSVYCDQRENRKMMSEYSHGHVLDLCCYHGGFALNAFFNARHDDNNKSVVASCTGVDSSLDAIESCRFNAQLNGYNENDDNRRKLEFIQSDITMFLQKRATDAGNGIDGNGLLYDVVILDPPKLAPTAAALDKARRKYHALNRDAVKVVNRESGGLFLTCTCSAAMTQKDGGEYFLSMVQGAAQAAGRQVTLLRVSGAASCHVQSPVSWPAGNYLTAALFFVHPISS